MVLRSKSCCCRLFCCCFLLYTGLPCHLCLEIDWWIQALEWAGTEGRYFSKLSEPKNQLAESTPTFRADPKDTKRPCTVCGASRGWMKFASYYIDAIWCNQTSKLMLCLYVLVMSCADLCLPLLVAWLQWPLRRRTQTQTVVVHIWMIQYHSVFIVPVPWMATDIHHRDWTCKILQFSEIHNQEENARPVSVSGQAKHVQNLAVQHAHMFTHLLRWHLRVVLPTSSSAIAKLWTRCEARVQT